MRTRKAVVEGQGFAGQGQSEEGLGVGCHVAGKPAAARGRPAPLKGADQDSGSRRGANQGQQVGDPYAAPCP